MAQLVINLVRFTHMDYEDIWFDNQKSLFKSTQIDKFHYFLYCLKNNGIYANINLHVSRIYPEISGKTRIMQQFKYGKALDRYYPTFIQHQLNYAKELLTYYNNYTGFSIGDDPMILNIELNNENSIFDLEIDEKVNALDEVWNLKSELLKQWRSYISWNTRPRKQYKPEAIWKKSFIVVLNYN